jgi:hypothetical protein
MGKIVLDQRESDEVRSERRENRSFQKHDDGFASVRSCGGPYGGPIEDGGPSHDRLSALRPLKRQGRRIIQIQWMNKEWPSNGDRRKYHERDTKKTRSAFGRHGLCVSDALANDRHGRSASTRHR